MGRGEFYYCLMDVLGIRLINNEMPHTSLDRNIRGTAQFVRMGPLPMISGVIVKSEEKFRLDPDYQLYLYLYIINIIN